MHSERVKFLAMKLVGVSTQSELSFRARNTIKSLIDKIPGLYELLPDFILLSHALSLSQSNGSGTLMVLLGFN